MTRMEEKIYTYEKIKEQLLLIEEHLKDALEDKAICAPCVRDKHLVLLRGYLNEGLGIFDTERRNACGKILKWIDKISQEDIAIADKDKINTYLTDIRTFRKEMLPESICPECTGRCVGDTCSIEKEESNIENLVDKGNLKGNIFIVDTTGIDNVSNKAYFFKLCYQKAPYVIVLENNNGNVITTVVTSKSDSDLTDILKSPGLPFKVSIEGNQIDNVIAAFKDRGIE